MNTPTTERLHDNAKGLDMMPLAEAARVFADGQIAAASAVLSALPAIAQGAAAMADTVRAGATLHYVAAGSSGLMAAADAQELGGTFSIPPEQVRIHMAGGLPTGVEMPGAVEDDVSDLAAALADLSPRDTVIAISASGTTPYTVAAATIASERGATLIGIANNPGGALLTKAAVPILVATPPEVISGSTRMGAGTAQKIVLNMLSSLMALDLGHVHDGMMVNLRADNTKLRQRATGIVSTIASVTPDAARKALDTTEGVVKSAVLVAAGLSPADAQARLDACGGKLRDAMKRTE